MAQCNVYQCKKARVTVVVKNWKNKNYGPLLLSKIEVCGLSAYGHSYTQCSQPFMLWNFVGRLLVFLVDFVRS
jgi:hypothetical protein